MIGMHKFRPDVDHKPRVLQHADKIGDVGKAYKSKTVTVQTPSRERKQAYAYPHPKGPCVHSEGFGAGLAVRWRKAAGGPSIPVAAGNKESDCTDDGRGARRY